jgi:hypothetical protein
MPNAQRGRTNPDARNRNRGSRTTFASGSGSDSCPGGPGSRQRNPNPLVARSASDTAVTVIQLLGEGLADIERTHRPRPSLSFYRSDANVERTHRPVPLHAPDRRPPVHRRGRDFSFRSGRKCPARTFIRQPKTDRRRVHRLSSFIRNLNREPSRGPRTRGIRQPLSFRDSNLQNGRVGRRPSGVDREP